MSASFLDFLVISHKSRTITTSARRAVKRQRNSEKTEFGPTFALFFAGLILSSSSSSESCFFFFDFGICEKTGTKISVASQSMCVYVLSLFPLSILFLSCFTLLDSFLFPLQFTADPSVLFLFFARMHCTPAA